MCLFFNYSLFYDFLHVAEPNRTAIFTGPDYALLCNNSYDAHIFRIFLLLSLKSFKSLKPNNNYVMFVPLE